MNKIKAMGIAVAIVSATVLLLAALWPTQQRFAPGKRTEGCQPFCNDAVKIIAAVQAN